ncbi:MAG: mechanosensitive ion channel [Clostridiaceae bacterium]|jgi:small conductance mechanosensitive channel|nr:mechanosensitive ion channel [Clostridiaceae bacterium]
MEQFKNFIVDFMKNFGTNILEAVAVLLLGIIVIKLASALIRRILHRTRLEGTAVTFFASLVSAALTLVLFFLVMRILNVDTTGVLAIAAASGLAVGLALQNSLANVAGGIILLCTKPFREGDKINVAGIEGVVKKMRITTTELLTTDNVVIIVPNAKLVDSSILNFSSRPTRRIDLNVGAAYDSDIDQVKAAVAEIISADERILTVPAPEIRVSELQKSAVNYLARIWVKQEDYWSVVNGFPETVLRKFTEKNIVIPFEALTVYVKENNA